MSVNEKLRNKLHNALKLSGFSVRREFCTLIIEKFLEEGVELKNENFDNIVKELCSSLESQCLSEQSIEREHIDRALEVCLHAGYDRHETIFSIINAFDFPKLVYNPDRKMYFMSTDKSKILSDADAKAKMFLERYSTILQRTKRCFADSERGQVKLQTVDYLLTLSYVTLERTMILGSLLQVSEGKYYLEDPTGIVQLDLTHARYHVGFFAENCFVLVNGYYEDKVLHVSSIVLPPGEEYKDSRIRFGNINYFGGLSTVPLRDSRRLKEHLSRNKCEMIMFFSDVWLDHPLANKFSKLSVKDFIKESPGGPRLQSLRLPRDLSLGGSKLPKKIYKPNVNVARNKDKPKEFVKKDREFKGKRNNDLHNTRKQKFVQSSGIFSDGMGDGHRLTEKRVVNHSRDIEKPVLKLNRTSDKTSSSLLPDKKADMELSDCLLKYEEDEDDDSKESDNSGPVNWNSLDLTKKPIKTELKEEAAVASSIFCDKNSREISNSNPTMTLWRLPSCLAIKNTVEKKLVNCTLTDLPEGKIGKVFEKLELLFDGLQMSPPIAFVFMGNFMSESQGCKMTDTLRKLLKKLADLIYKFPNIVNASQFVFVPGMIDPCTPHLVPRLPLPKCLTEDFSKTIPKAIFATNPCRLQYCTKEIVLFRADVVPKLLQGSLHKPARDEISGCAVRTVVSQGHLSPLSLNSLTVHWGFDYCLRLYPLPDLVVIGDKFEAYQEKYKECQVINPGPFCENGFQFKSYVPFTDSVDDCQL
ncbi:hypothetical protein NQ315_009745 [Exocentrus adspersus]|uniref:DNA polymerase II subunit 2 n=1 Tax=Exocentrus adspersus TaxID=1586481 RepID=A0AAV8WHQ5_9CUCU|nr:hypothetical protein NQ315_009745 [Exocentrus adspersus]